MRLARIAVCLGLVLMAFDAKAQGEPLADTPPPTDLGFLVGETLTYGLKWGFISVGQCMVSTGWIEEGGRKLLRIEARTRSNKALSSIYPVDDVVESVVDAVTFRPVRFTRNLKEGRKRYHDETTFDFGTMTADWRSFIKDRRRGFSLEHDSRDLLTFMYYMRRFPVAEKAKSQYRVMADDKLYDLTVESFSSEFVELETYGKVESIKMEPTAAFEGLFVRKGRMFLWVSTDERRVLTKAEVETPFANVHIQLEGVSGPGCDRWVR